MKKNLIFIVITLILTLSASSLLLGQQAVVTAGADATGTGGTVSYSVGQVVYQTHTVTNGSVAEGMQQPLPKWLPLTNRVRMGSRAYKLEQQ